LSQHVLQEISDYELQRPLTIERNNVRAPSCFSVFGADLCAGMCDSVVAQARMHGQVCSSIPSLARVAVQLAVLTSG